MADDLRFRLRTLHGVFTTWSLLAAFNAIDGTVQILRSHWIGCANLAVAGCVAVLYVVVLRPRITQVRTSLRNQDVKDRQARIAELEKELGIG